MASIMTSRQAAELDHAFERNGFTPELVKKLSEGKMLKMVREVLLNRAEIKQVEYLVDLNADPFVPEDWKVVEHRKGGKFMYDPAKVGLYLNKDQKKGKVIVGNDLCKELKNQPVMNANLMDFYLENRHLIPESWKGKHVFFWGTIYRDEISNLCVRGFYWDYGVWVNASFTLGSAFDGNYPSAVSVS